MDKFKRRGFTKLVCFTAYHYLQQHFLDVDEDQKVVLKQEHQQIYDALTWYVKKQRLNMKEAIYIEAVTKRSDQEISHRIKDISNLIFALMTLRLLYLQFPGQHPLAFIPKKIVLGGVASLYSDLMDLASSKPSVYKEKSEIIRHTTVAAEIWFEILNRNIKGYELDTTTSIREQYDVIYGRNSNDEIND